MSNRAAKEFSDLDEEVKFVPTKKEILETVGQPEKKRKRQDVSSLQEKDDEIPKPPSKRVQRDSEQASGPKDDLINLHKDVEDSLLVVNFGVKPEAEAKIAGFDMVSF